MCAYPPYRHFENAAPAHGTTEAGDINAAGKPAAPGAKQRELLDRTLATWAWDKQFEDGQAEVAQHLADVYAKALEPLSPKQIGNNQGDAARPPLAQLHSDGR